ncbi:hypothetical protein RCH07_003335 [Arthrobacter sp. CG_A4]|nr:hypothetical protein [Arthrobacter sp. CG_A4]
MNAQTRRAYHPTIGIIQKLLLLDPDNTSADGRTRGGSW